MNSLTTGSSLTSASLAVARHLVATSASNPLGAARQLLGGAKDRLLASASPAGSELYGWGLPPTAPATPAAVEANTPPHDLSGNSNNELAAWRSTTTSTATATAVATSSSSSSSSSDAVLRHLPPGQLQGGPDCEGCLRRELQLRLLQLQYENSALLSQLHPPPPPQSSSSTTSSSSPSSSSFSPASSSSTVAPQTPPPGMTRERTLLHRTVALFIFTLFALCHTLYPRLRSAAEQAYTWERRIRCHERVLDLFLALVAWLGGVLEVVEGEEGDRKRRRHVAGALLRTALGEAVSGAVEGVASGLKVWTVEAGERPDKDAEGW